MQSVFETAYLRGLFPEEEFSETFMANLDNMKLMMPTLESPDTRRMQAWLEQDVAVAVKAGYLHRLHFVISEDRAGFKLVEQYTWTFGYTADGVLV